MRLLKDKWTSIEGVAGPEAFVGKEKEDALKAAHASACPAGRGGCPVAPIGGNKQFVNKGGEGDLMMLYTDMALVWDPVWRQHIEVYAKDVQKLRTDFGAVFKKLTEFNCPACAGTTAGRL